MSRVLVIGSYDAVSRAIAEELGNLGVPAENAVGHADALQKLRLRSFGVVITGSETSIDEDLALLEEMRLVRPAVKCIVLAPQSTPDDVIVAMRARAFACFSAPFEAQTIAALAADAIADNARYNEIQIVSAQPGWVTVRASAQLITAERLLTFAKELNSRVPEGLRQEMLQGLREILLNAMEHGAGFSSEQMVEVTAIRTGRAMVFYVRDPGPGFRRGALGDGAIADLFKPPIQHVITREEEGLRPGGYGLLLAGGTVDELIYNEIGNEVILIKYLDAAS
jgi:anti-sigma regulatory factor (Ser/Thr protein kinase)/CheY-like chemotaxis protein